MDEFDDVNANIRVAGKLSDLRLRVEMVRARITQALVVQHTMPGARYATVVEELLLDALFELGEHGEPKQAMWGRLEGEPGREVDLSTRTWQRRLETLRMTANGKTVDEMAEVLGVTDATVLHDTRMLMTHLIASNVANLVHEGHRRGLLSNQD